MPISSIVLDWFPVVLAPILVLPQLLIWGKKDYHRFQEKLFNGAEVESVQEGRLLRRFPFLSSEDVNAVVNEERRSHEVVGQIHQHNLSNAIQVVDHSNRSIATEPIGGDCSVTNTSTSGSSLELV